FAGDVRSRAMDGLKDARHPAGRVDARAGRQAERAHQRAAEVTQDIAEQVGADHHAECVRGGDEARAQGIDVILGSFDIWILAPDGVEYLVPEDHRVLASVGFGGALDAPEAVLAGVLEGVTNDPLGAGAGEDGGLHGRLVRRAGVYSTADASVFALGVLADDDEIDVLWTTSGQRPGDAGQETHRPQVDPHVEGLADRQQHAPERDVVGHAGEAAGAEIDGVMLAEAVQRIVVHHLAVFEVVAAGVRIAGVVELQAAVQFGEAIQYANSLL